MVNVSAGHSMRVSTITKPSGVVFAVYDPCITINGSGQDFAFIEERLCSAALAEQDVNDECYFNTLSEAKAYAIEYFVSGAEYFSLKQSCEPDNIIFTLLDKITYLIA